MSFEEVQSLDGVRVANDRQTGQKCESFAAEAELRLNLGKATKNF